VNDVMCCHHIPEFMNLRNIVSLSDLLHTAPVACCRVEVLLGDSSASGQLLVEQQVTSFSYCIQNILLHCDVFVQCHVGEGGRGLPFLMVYGSWKMFRSKAHLLRDESNLLCGLSCSG
jgi:hypothetical protein